MISDILKVGISIDAALGYGSLGDFSLTLPSARTDDIGYFMKQAVSARIFSLPLENFVAVHVKSLLIRVIC